MARKTVCDICGEQAAAKFWRTSGQIANRTGEIRAAFRTRVLDWLARKLGLRFEYRTVPEKSSPGTGITMKTRDLCDSCRANLERELRKLSKKERQGEASE